MKKTNNKTRFLRTIWLITAGALTLTMLIGNYGGFKINDASARYLAQATEEVTSTGETTAIEEAITPTTTESTATEESNTSPAAETIEPFTAEAPALPELPTTTGPCENLRNNQQTNASPLTTVSENCVTATVTEGTVAFDYIPNSFSFPLKYTSNYPQDSFSNDDPATMNVDVSTGTDDIMTLHDFRNNGGFSVTATVSAFESAGGSIPLSNLFVATSYPDPDDFDMLDATLTGAENGGVEYADGSKGAQDITSSTLANGDLGIPETYAVSFDQNNDDIADIVELMNTTTGHVGRFSQALNFLLKIPANQLPGTYQVKFTIDLVY